MTVQHTPGPWERGASETVRGADGHRVVDLALCYRSAEMINANAALIAAAPDLLEACRTFSLWLEREETGYTKIAEHPRDGSEEGERHWREWYQENLRICDLAQTQARAAIAKAIKS